MSHGLPDYYRGVDIAYQALARLMVRPTYGAALRGEGCETVTARDETTLVSVEGKGMLYGGILWLWHDSTQKNSAVKLNVDGNWIAAGTLAFLNRYCGHENPHYGIYSLRFDEVNFNYSIAVAYGITFETGFSISYVENHGETPDVCAEIIYALI